MSAHLEHTMESTVRKEDRVVLGAEEKQITWKVKNANLCSLEPGWFPGMGSVGTLEEPEPELCPWNNGLCRAKG